MLLFHINIIYLFKIDYNTSANVGKKHICVSHDILVWKSLTHETPVFNKVATSGCIEFIKLEH